MKDIKVGDKVVCVHSEGIEHALTNGKRYTVEGIKSRETEYNGLSFFKYFLTTMDSKSTTQLEDSRLWKI